MSSSQYAHLLKSLPLGGGAGDGKAAKYYDLASLDPARYGRLPFSIRVLLESAVRNCDEFQVKNLQIGLNINPRLPIHERTLTCYVFVTRQYEAIDND